VTLTVAAMAAVGLAACNDGPTEPEWEVIEDVEFASSLNIDLSAMTELPEGVWIQDRVAGTGDAVGAAPTSTTWLFYRLWLSNGAFLQSNELAFPYPLGGIEGWDIGLEGMMEGGTRLMLIPPELAYGANGNGPIPPGAVLVFEIELDSIT
jgi:FKBP-type peptidyl-prolyl cis-trans isomerase